MSTGKLKQGDKVVMNHEFDAIVFMVVFVSGAKAGLIMLGATDDSVSAFDVALLSHAPRFDHSEAEDTDCLFNSVHHDPEDGGEWRMAFM